MEAFYAEKEEAKEAHKATKKADRAERRAKQAAMKEKEEKAARRKRIRRMAPARRRSPSTLRPPPSIGRRLRCHRQHRSPPTSTGIQNRIV
jgi:hypothetical protein